jgi:hypothetical protein
LLDNVAEAGKISHRQFIEIQLEEKEETMCLCAGLITPLEGVTVYGRNDSRGFHDVRRFFNDRGVIFTHADTSSDQENQDKMISLSGQEESVVVEIGRNVFVGFVPEQIETALP